jgi:hypothetical protein
MQQAVLNGEATRTLGHDDVATLRLARSGIDETEGTGDDYTVTLSYAGLSTGCDPVLDFDDGETGFAVCQLNGTFIDPPTFDHIEITSAQIYFNTGTRPGNAFDWFFNPVRLEPPPEVPALAWPGAAGLAALLFAAGSAVRRRRRSLCGR